MSGRRQRMDDGRDRMLDHIDAAGAQIPEKTTWIADSGDGVCPLAAEVLERLRTCQTVQPVRLATLEGHVQGWGRKPVFPHEQRCMLGNAIDDDDTGLPRGEGRL